MAAGADGSSCNLPSAAGDSVSSANSLRARRGAAPVKAGVAGSVATVSPGTFCAVASVSAAAVMFDDANLIACLLPVLTPSGSARSAYCKSPIFSRKKPGPAGR